METSVASRRLEHLWPLVLVLALIASFGSRPASAQTGTPTPQPAAANCPGQPEMTFTSWSSDLGQMFGEGSREYIFADGYFCTDSDKKFEQFVAQNPPKAPNRTVVFNSGGGDIGAGLRMGQFIRQQKMWTQVGSQFPVMIPQNENIAAATVPYLAEPAAPPFPGECASICTFAFMGGTVRTIGYASNYGVHQFTLNNPAAGQESQADQTTSASLVAYITQMGISADYMVLMVQKSGNNVTNLTSKQLRELNIVTPRWQTKWQIAPLTNGSGFYLQGISVDPWGTHEVALRCPPKAAPGQTAPALIADFYIELGTRAKAQDLVGAVQSYLVEESGRYVMSPIPAKGSPPSAYGTNQLFKSLTLGQGTVAPLLDGTAPYIGVAFLIDPAAKLPMRVLKFEATVNATLLKQFMSTCPK
jgi:hypothetical protein